MRVVLQKLVIVIADWIEAIPAYSPQNDARSKVMPFCWEL